jgi:hypothetical protein
MLNIDNKGTTPILMSLDKIQISTANSHYSFLSASDIEYERDQQLRSMKSGSTLQLYYMVLLRFPSPMLTTPYNKPCNRISALKTMPQRKK